MVRVLVLAVVVEAVLCVVLALGLRAVRSLAVDALTGCLLRRAVRERVAGGAGTAVELVAGRLRSVLEAAGVSACCGVAVAEPGECLPEVVARADEVMYREKRRAVLDGAVRYPAGRVPAWR